MGSFPYHLKSHYPYKIWYLGYKNCFFFFSPENMICLMFSQSHWSMAAIFFYTCFWIPLLQMKRALARLVGFVFFFPCQVEQEEDQMGCSQMCLPVARFQDLQDHGSLRCGQEALEETCSICLVEFEKEDVVSQLSKCGHVFHMDCIERWIERSHFTCPICRSLFFNVKTSHAKWDESVNSSSSYLNGVSWYY